MKPIIFNQVRNFRKERNTDLIRRMQSGEQLTSFNSYSSWYPPRPIIEKDKKAVLELYGSESMLGVQNQANQDDCKSMYPSLRLA